MSEVKKPYDITAEELKKVNYHNLAEEFKKLGIPSTWQAATKKDVLIKNAIDKLAIVKRLVEEEGQALDAALEYVELTQQEQEDKAAQAAADEAKKQQDAQKEQEAKNLEEVKEAKLTKDEIESNLKNIEANLRACPETHRLKLIQKQRSLKALLAEMEAEEELVVGKGGAAE